MSLLSAAEARRFISTATTECRRRELPVELSPTEYGLDGGACWTDDDWYVLVEALAMMFGVEPDTILKYDGHDHAVRVPVTDDEGNTLYTCPGAGTGNRSRFFIGRLRQLHLVGTGTTQP